jgi:starch synthase
MRVLFVTAEAFPFVKTGGLGDVCGALPSALARQGVDIKLLMPAYPSALAGIEDAQVVSTVDPILGVKDRRVVSGRMPGTNSSVWLVDAPELYRRDGGPYLDSLGKEWSDNARRFAYLNHVAARIAQGCLSGWIPDIVHANDWHTGLLPWLLSSNKAPHPATVFTIHNMAFQGNFPMEMLADIGIPNGSCPASLEYYGQVSFLKAGILHCDRLTTVSPNYAKEVLMPEFGCGMDGLLRERIDDFDGILNGIDYGLWNPQTDPYLVQNFGPQSLAGKKSCKAALQEEFGLPINPEAPLIGFVSRLVHQKMADVVLEILPWLAEFGAQFVLLATGDKALEGAFFDRARAYPDSVAVHIGYEEPKAHRLQAGADLLLAPSRFEPCGLNQLYALRYGTLPVIRRTGGLADTIVDTTPHTMAACTATGFVFQDATPEDLKRAIQRALQFYCEPLTWRRLRVRAMKQDFSWRKSADRYHSLYRSLGGGSTHEEDQESLTNDGSVRLIAS